MKPSPAPKHFDKQVVTAGEKVSKVVEQPQTPQQPAKPVEVQSEPTKVETVAAPAAEKPIVAERPTITQSKQELMAQAGIPQSDWEATDYIITKESSWNPTAMNRSSGALGLCQALPGTKMASEGADYQTNPVTQLRWCHKYAVQRYGGWWASFAFWRANRWW